MADDLGTLVREIMNEVRISDSVNMTNCIRDAISHYETERFDFNQFRNQTFSLSSSQEYYTSADNSMIPRLMELDKVALTVSSTYKPTLDKWSWNYMEDINADGVSQGQPLAYSYWGQQLRFYPVPGSGYEVRISGVLQAPSLSVSTDSNCWTIRGQGKELIKQRAKSIYYSEFRRDDANAARAEKREADALQRLRAKTNQLHATGDVTPCL